MNKKGEVDYLVIFFATIFLSLIVSGIIFYYFNETTSNLIETKTLTYFQENNFLRIIDYQDSYLTTLTPEYDIYSPIKNVNLKIKCGVFLNNDSYYKCSDKSTKIIKLDENIVNYKPEIDFNLTEINKIRISLLYNDNEMYFKDFIKKENYSLLHLKNFPDDSKIYLNGKEVFLKNIQTNQKSILYILSKNCNKLIDLNLKGETEIDYNNVCSEYNNYNMSLEINKNNSNLYCNLIINGYNADKDFYFLNESKINYNYIQDKSNTLDTFEVRCNNNVIFYKENTNIENNYFKNFKMKFINITFTKENNPINTEGEIIVFPGNNKYYSENSIFNDILIPYTNLGISSSLQKNFFIIKYNNLETKEEQYLYYSSDEDNYEVEIK